MKYKVAQIIPYFGKWPEWIELYMYSCGHNPIVDFIFYTDCPLPKHMYANTLFHICTFEEYMHLVGTRLGIEYSVNSAYKLTDLKPFLGAIHKPELEEYDFWGFGDIDLVYGDLSMFVNDANLKKYDVLTTHNYHIAGHFTLCRNNDYYRNLCFKICNWQSGLVEDQHYGYDEVEWSRLVYPCLDLIRFFHNKVLRHLGIKFCAVLDRLNPIFGRKKMFVEFWTSPEPSPKQNCNPEWVYDLKHGRVFRYDGRALPYLHFLFFKKTPWLETEYYWRNGFYQLDDDFEKYKSIIFNWKIIKGLYDSE